MGAPVRRPPAVPPTTSVNRISGATSSTEVWVFFTKLVRKAFTDDILDSINAFSATHPHLLIKAHLPQLANIVAGRVAIALEDAATMPLPTDDAPRRSAFKKRSFTIRPPDVDEGVRRALSSAALLQARTDPNVAPSWAASCRDLDTRRRHHDRGMAPDRADTFPIDAHINAQHSVPESDSCVRARPSWRARSRRRSGVRDVAVGPLAALLNKCDRIRAARGKVRDDMVL